MRAILAFVTRVQVMLAALALVVVLSPPRAESYGDRLQLALPALAWACEAKAGTGVEFLLRYAAMFTVAHGTKRALGPSEINDRPDGGRHGWPSAHTSTAVLGASSMVHGCLRNQPIAQGVMLLTAGFVGASRVEADKHDIWQVLAGAVLGWVSDRALRRPSARRDRARRVVQAVGGGIAAAARAVANVARRGWAVIYGNSTGP